MTQVGSDSSQSPDQGGEGQNYLASVSDLVSAFIFVFIIMLALFAFRLATATEEQASVTDELKAASETRDSILTGIARRLEDSGIRVTILLEQGVLRLSENAINFPSGRETPTPEHYVHVGSVAKAIADVVPCYVSVSASESTRGAAPDQTTSDGSIGMPQYCQLRADPAAYDCRERRFPWLLETLLIEGHTDAVPVARGQRFMDNLELSSMRAATVHRMIAACEPGVEYMLNSHGYPILSTSGYGHTRPATSDPGRTDDNRRIDLRFLLEPPPGALQFGESEVQSEIRERVGERRR